MFLKHVYIKATENGPTGRKKGEFLGVAGLALKKTVIGSQRIWMTLDTTESRKRRNQQSSVARV